MEQLERSAAVERFQRLEHLKRLEPPAGLARQSPRTGVLGQGSSKTIGKGLKLYAKA